MQIILNIPPTADLGMSEFDLKMTIGVALYEKGVMSSGLIAKALGIDRADFIRNMVAGRYTSKTKMKKARVVVLTKDGKVTPMDIKWSERFKVPTNVARYVKPLVPEQFRDGGFVVSPNRGYVWTGNKAYDWYTCCESPEFKRAVSAIETDDTLWDKLIG